MRKCTPRSRWPRTRAMHTTIEVAPYGEERLTYVVQLASWPTAERRKCTPRSRWPRTRAMHTTIAVAPYGKERVATAHQVQWIQTDAGLDVIG